MKTLYDEYLSKKHPVYRYKAVIDYFVYLKDDELVNEFTSEMISILQNAIQKVGESIDDETLSKDEKYYLTLAIEEGERVLNHVTVLEPM